MERDSSDSKQSWSIAVLASMTALAALAVGLRLLARHERKQKLWWDDWLIIFSLAWNLVVMGFIIGMIQYGMGLHATQIPMDNLVMIAKFLLIAEILYVSNLVWTKISILMMYYRIFHFPFFKRWAYIIGAFIIIWLILVIFLFIFTCVPIEKQWNPMVPGHCISLVGIGVANSASTILSDLAILILPIRQIWKLQLRKAEKVALTFAFGLGFFVIFASAYRLAVVLTYNELDASYSLAPVVGWTVIEMSAGIVSACLPTLRPVLFLLARKLGIQNSLSFFRSESSAALTKKSRQNLVNGAQSVGDSANDGKAGQRPFYRLPDESRSAEQNRVKTSFDPTAADHVYVNTVSSGMGGEGDTETASGDEVPLQSIRVQKDFTLVHQRLDLSN
ncbi:hypothetical protein T310_4273 [Rasamsonia emersonii CBS 393.64]|uniref:Rhodopsin domain-containing protein n=1 Tax=Rasamsonia emersonii (strain ATCC 16479 / CBS 393.64 / IMI 116815) TaxID=1408163 RepID=A0A0F4YU02_RASE3|nr:hypothetical protein T310_4273 [Rasamsonia emersonii CBS 393.64]KKA21752.1 hypothetical protein T310_4273 [Rasamsonia emersonii CBS 393.64]